MVLNLELLRFRAFSICLELRTSSFVCYNTTAGVSVLSRRTHLVILERAGSAGLYAFNEGLYGRSKSLRPVSLLGLPLWGSFREEPPHSHHTKES